MHFDNDEKIRFTIFGLSHRLYRESEVTVGSEDPLQRAYLFKRFQVEHVLTVPIYTPPY